MRWNISGLLSIYPEQKSIFLALTRNAGKESVQRLRKGNQTQARLFEQLKKKEKVNKATGKFLIVIFVIITLYGFPFEYLIGLRKTIHYLYLSAPIILALFAASYIFVKISGYKLSEFGVNLDNWKRCLTEGIVFSIPFLILTLIAKMWLLGPEDRYNITSLLSNVYSYPFLKIYGYIAFYILSSIIQEFVTRGCTQSMFRRFFEGKYSTIISITLANFIFSILHLHVSLGASILVFFPGMFWGWLYQRHRSLLGVSVSHILIGVWALFIVGFGAFVRGV